MGVAFVIGN